MLAVHSIVDNIHLNPGHSNGILARDHQVNQVNGNTIDILHRISSNLIHQCNRYDAADLALQSYQMGISIFFTSFAGLSTAMGESGTTTSEWTSWSSGTNATTTAWWKAIQYASATIRLYETSANAVSNIGNTSQKRHRFSTR